MKIKKAVITAAGRDQNKVPLQVLVDRDGIEKAAIRIIIEEVLSAGADEVALIVAPGDQALYQGAIGTVSARLHFIEQHQPRGYGHALLCAREFTAREPFLHLVSDHLYLSGQEKRCAQQLVEVAEAEQCAVSAVQATRESMLPFYGAVGGKGADHKRNLYVIDRVVEKPTPTLAEQELIVPGLRAGHYLCFFGMHALNATLMEILARQFDQAQGNLSLSPALAEMARREKYLAYEVEGRRYNLGVKFGLFTTQLAFGLAGGDREELLAQMVELLATPPFLIMRSKLVEIITSPDAATRNAPLDPIAAELPLAALLAEAEALDRFRRQSDNLYERVRALFFLYAIHRFHLPVKQGVAGKGSIPFRGYEDLLQRRFPEAIEAFLKSQQAEGPNDSISSALAAAYHGLAFQTLADQVRKSVRSARGNQWMFRTGHVSDQPLRIRPELLRRDGTDGPFPILRELTAVRMDLTHSAWSDIFFLGMDYPEGARVLNVSIDLAVRGRDKVPRPPVEAYLRVIDEPVLRISSVDLGATTDITELGDVFDFARDYLGLLKAAVIASGIVPPGLEGSGQSLRELLAHLAGPGLGLEIVSSVNDIPKGSRLAVSTNLLAGLISVCMRATGQTASLTGPLEERERRIVAARAILGEWIGGSGGGWQDSGGVWPGIKLIEGVLAEPGDPEDGVSRGRLLPRHQILGPDQASAELRANLQQSLVLVHGGMAQNVGPILEMVTEKYLLRSEAEWQARQTALGFLDEVLQALKTDNVRAIGEITTRNFFGPIQTIIPWATTFYTERLIEQVRTEFGRDFWGFWMLGGMSGGGMGFIFAPSAKARGQDRLREIMLARKRELEHALPFAMDPVVYDFEINETGTRADLFRDDQALLPSGYYAMIVPTLLRADKRQLSPLKRNELDRFGAACRVHPELSGMVQTLFDRLFPPAERSRSETRALSALLEETGFDAALHEQIRADLRTGRIGLAQNRLPASSTIEDVRPGDVIDTRVAPSEADRARGMEALRNGEVAVVTLAAGVGSRWTQGAGVVKAFHPFCKLGGRHRTFLEVHLAKSRRVAELVGATLPHVFTTSYLTHGPIAEFLRHAGNYNYEGTLLLSEGRSVGLRLVPMVRDLRFAWEEMPRQVLDEQKQKVRASLNAALMDWARARGEGSDYTDNLPAQCMHPVGHWFELPNMLRNGTLARLLQQRPALKYLLLHNIDTLGASVDPGLLGLHIRENATLSFEVITRRIEDRGGGLARVNDQVRLVEGLAMPREEDEFRLSYYNSMTTWIALDPLLDLFGLKRGDLDNLEKVQTAVRALSQRMPSYITLKEVKKRWGHGQEDVYPVTQFEKLWGDMTTLPEAHCRFFVVPRVRGQQLKEQAQLDSWFRDGSAPAIESLCRWAD